MEIILSVGSNLGDRKKNIDDAISLLSNTCNILKCSEIFETEPFGNKDQSWFLNLVLIVNTRLSPGNLLFVCKTIENKLGRTDAPRWSERIIDIDILMYNDLILNTPQLIIPHKYLHLRNFVLIPLNDIAPNITHPILKKTISQLLIESPDNSIVNHYLS